MLNGPYRFLFATIAATSLAGFVAACEAEREADDVAAEQGAAEDMATESAAAESGEQAAAVPTYDAETFFETTTYFLAASDGHAFSPDGTMLLVDSDESGVFNAYALPVGGGEAQQLTDSTTNAVYGVSYFPNDARVLYTFDEGGDELNHVHVREEDGTTRDLTPGEDLKASFAGWSGDGESFYLLTTERDQKNFDLYRYNASDYARELVFENDGYSIAAISDDGRWLALEKPRTSADSDIYIVDLESSDKAPKLITEHEGNINYGVYDFTPDGSQLVYSTDENGEWLQAWTYDLGNEDKAPLIEADWDVQFVSYSPSGKYRVSGVNADATTEVSIVDAESGDELEIDGLPEGDIRNVRFNRDETKIAFLLNGDRAPSNVYVMELGGAPQQLTEALNPEIDRAHLVESKVVRYASYDGLEIPSILYRPHGASADDPAPALVWVHGGPGGQSRRGYNPTIQHLVNHGYVVLAANNRGSGGYGKTFWHMDDKKHGDVDLKDIVEAKSYLAEMDWVDGERIGVIGGSYGGYMVAAALAFHPEVFDAGVNIFGVTNWERTLSSIPPWWESFKEALYDEMGDPATDQERHRAISPLFHADNIEAPLLVVQGANDPRVLKIESDELVEAVRANDVPVEYVVFDDEGHGFRRKENRIAASNAYVEFLDRYLKGEGSEGL